MPRPSKHVSPDTLGGRIRAAREHLHLSLAEVASGQYSTSLISQIERNRVDPSQESLSFLADRLKLPIDDLKILVSQQRESEVEAREYTSFDTLRSKAAQLLVEKQIDDALESLKDLHFAQVPPLQRWRLAALRGQCYFERRAFVKAHSDFVYATQEEPRRENLPPEQKQELLSLRLHLAATYRELCQLDEAFEHYAISLEMMNGETPFGYVAEAHWGMAGIALERATKEEQRNEDGSKRKAQLALALDHANYAQLLYRSIGDALHADSLTYLVYAIEFEQGRIQDVRHGLLKLVKTWALNEPVPETASPSVRHSSQKQANIVSLASCLLAELAYVEQDYQQALTYAQAALAAGKQSYILSRANAYITLGRIYNALQSDAQAEQAYRDALRELEHTERIGMRISTHIRLGMYLMCRGRTGDGERELEQARTLSEMVVSGIETTARGEA